MFGKTTVFLSYRRNSSRELARYVHDKLVDFGADVFFDVETMNAGRFAAIIEHEIIQRQHFLIILKPDTLDSEWVRREIQTALKYRKNIVILTADGFKFESHVHQEVSVLGEYNGIPYDYQFAEASLERVVKALGLNKRSITKSPLFWLASLAALSLMIIGIGIPALSQQRQEQFSPTLQIATASISSVLSVQTQNTQVTSLPSPSDTPSPTTEITPTATSTFTYTNTHTNTHTPTDTYTMTSTITPSPPPTEPDTPTHTLQPPQPTTTLVFSSMSGEYPCEAQIISQTGAQTVNVLRAYASERAPIVIQYRLELRY